MVELFRRSPVRFDAAASRTESRENWTLVLEYESEGGDGPRLVDLSHKPRWDVQHPQIGRLEPFGGAVPEEPGRCVLEGGVLVNRMNRRQASVWRLDRRDSAPPEVEGATETTEASVFLALFGENAFGIAEKLTSLDFGDPALQPPRLLQGPFCHVPCQIVLLDKSEDGGFLFTCSRGYAQSMAHAVFDAGSEFGLRPAGEDRFEDWVGSL